MCLRSVLVGCDRLLTLIIQRQQLSFCAGTMFFGAATEQSKAFQLLDMAAERGVNFFDTAEMYPVPQSAEHQGHSERVLGNWLKAQQR